MTKKILSLLLVMIMCFTSVSMTFAVEGDITEPTDGYSDIIGGITEEETTVPDQPEVEEPTTETEEPTTEPEVPVTPEEPQEPEVPSEPIYDENEIVAMLHVFLIETTIHPIGHTWVYIENLTDRELQVGLYTLPPHEGVSVGVLARRDGWGIYYNVESYAQHVHGMEKQISMSDGLTAKKLEKVSKSIINYVNHWDPIFNCMYFAFTVWNSGSRRILLPLLLPVVGKLQMALYRHERNVQMKAVTKDQTFRQVGFGSFAYLTPATDKVLGPI